MHSPKCKTSPGFPVAFSKLLPSLASTYSSTEAEIIWRYPAQASVHRMWDVSKWNGPTKMSGKKRVDLQYLAQNNWIEGMQTYTCKNLCLKQCPDIWHGGEQLHCQLPLSRLLTRADSSIKNYCIGCRKKNNAISFNNCKAFSHCSPLPHALMTAPKVTSFGSTRWSGISWNKCRARCHWRPFSQALTAALQVTSCGESWKLCHGL